MLPPLPPPSGRRLSEDLSRVLEVTQMQEISVNLLLRTVRGRGFPALLAILALPFMLPVPLPGLSTPFGLAIGLFGLRLALLRRPLIPRWLLRRKIPPRAIQILVHRGVPIIRYAERWLHPRLLFLPRWAFFRSITGLAIASCGFALALPLPVPFSNTIPAVSILLLAAGMMEDDGIFILLGYGSTAAAWVFLGILVWMGQIGWHHLAHF
jgi:hypothetical protein